MAPVPKYKFMIYILYEAGEKYLPYIIQSQKYNIEPGLVLSSDFLSIILQIWGKKLEYFNLGQDLGYFLFCF